MPLIASSPLLARVWSLTPIGSLIPRRRGPPSHPLRRSSAMWTRHLRGSVAARVLERDTDLSRVASIRGRADAASHKRTGFSWDTTVILDEEEIQLFSLQESAGYRRTEHCRVRTTSAPSPRHRDGDGAAHIEGWLVLTYLAGNATITFRLLEDDGDLATFNIHPGMQLAFDNGKVTHEVSVGYRMLLGAVRLGSAGPQPRGGDPCCPDGEETCCGNLCYRCRRRLDERRRANRVVLCVEQEAGDVVARNIGGTVASSILVDDSLEVGEVLQHLADTAKIDGDVDFLIGGLSFASDSWPNLTRSRGFTLAEFDLHHGCGYLECVETFTYRRKGLWRPSVIHCYTKDSVPLVQFDDSPLHGTWEKRAALLTVWFDCRGRENRWSKTFAETAGIWEQTQESCCELDDSMALEACGRFDCGWRAWLEPVSMG